jgi:hypothetical protein
MEERDIHTYTSYNVPIVNAWVAATPLYAARSSRLYPGAQVVLVQHCRLYTVGQVPYGGIGSRCL